MSDSRTSARGSVSLAGHASMDLMCPLNSKEATSLLAAAGICAHSSLLDLGGGRGDFAALAAARLGCQQAVSVDRSEFACNEARRRHGSLGVEVVCTDMLEALATVAPRRAPWSLVAVVGAVQAFGGSGAESWARALATLRARASRVLLADMVALDAAAEAAFGIARLDRLQPLLDGEKVVQILRLPPERMLAYERDWRESVEHHLASGAASEAEADFARGRLQAGVESRGRAGRDVGAGCVCGRRH
jgi:cyclopropane fatty-acyl-phospholipid synthase-like methyltransferase